MWLEHWLLDLRVMGSISGQGLRPGLQVQSLAPFGEHLGQWFSTFLML